MCSSRHSPTPPSTRPPAHPHTGQEVILLFTVSMSGRFQGYARMTTPANKEGVSATDGITAAATVLRMPLLLPACFGSADA